MPHTGLVSNPEQPCRTTNQKMQSHHLRSFLTLQSSNLQVSQGRHRARVQLTARTAAANPCFGPRPATQSGFTWAGTLMISISSGNGLAILLTRSLGHHMRYRKMNLNHSRSAAKWNAVLVAAGCSAFPRGLPHLETTITFWLALSAATLFADGSTPEAWESKCAGKCFLGLELWMSGRMKVSTSIMST